MNNSRKKSLPHQQKDVKETTHSVVVHPPMHSVKKESWKSIVIAVSGGFVLGITVFFIVWQLIGTARSSGLEHEIELSPQEYFDSMKKDQGRYVVVDLRSRESYRKEHLKESVSVPVSITNGQIEKEDEILRAVGALDGKKILVFMGENSFSRTPYVVWQFVSRHGYGNALVMNAGWNEIRHLATFWLEEGQWNVFQIEDHTIQGK